MTKRLRLVSVVVQPQFLVDDGDLVPLQVNPLVVPAAEWPRVLDLFAAAVEELRTGIETAEVT